ncbi:MAG: hypothetical protein IJY82_02770 [Oscillospiraceae bacterium]|nr:hypothetical protein [Oscillospiraceae bacterium]
MNGYETVSLIILGIFAVFGVASVGALVRKGLASRGKHTVTLCILYPQREQEDAEQLIRSAERELEGRRERRGFVIVAGEDTSLRERCQMLDRDFGNIRFSTYSGLPALLQELAEVD